MDKEIININKDDLANIIFESVRRIINESNGMAYDIDISEISIDDLRKAYKDFRLIPIQSCFDDVLYSPRVIKEAFGDTLQPDTVVQKIINKYGLPERCVLKKEAYNKIYIYIVTAAIGINDKLIEDDMSKMGYYLGFKGKIQDVDGMKFQTLQFEPSSQLQNDETDNIISMYNVLYHWTPSYLLDSIMQNGLIPSHKNKFFNYPPRTYLMKGDSNDRYILGLGQSLCSLNDNQNNNGEYALLEVNIENIDDNVRFYYDSNSEIGIYTEQPISKDRIKIINIFQFVKNVKHP